MNDYDVHFTRSIEGEEERNGKAPVEASSPEEAEEKFLEQVADAEEFNVTEVKRKRSA